MADTLPSRARASNVISRRRSRVPRSGIACQAASQICTLGIISYAVKWLVRIFESYLYSPLSARKQSPRTAVLIMQTETAALPPRARARSISGAHANERGHAGGGIAPAVLATHRPQRRRHCRRRPGRHARNGRRYRRLPRRSRPAGRARKALRSSLRRLELRPRRSRRLRCVYHGWVFDVNGHCLETPAEPAEQHDQASSETARLSVS